MVDIVKQPGRLQHAPENFLSEEQVKAVGAGRRDFLRKSFLAAGAALIFGGDDLGGIAKKLLYVVLGVALIVFGANFLSMIGLVNSGALI